jgi:GWxTD domain-containing protein
MRTLFGIAGSLLALSVFLWAAPKPETGSMHSQGEGPQFRCQLGQRLGSEKDSLRLIAAISVPYDNLVFQRSDSGFTVRFELVTTVFKKDTMVDERISSLVVNTPDYAETNSRTKNAAHVDEFRVAAGDYRVRVILTLQDESRRKSRWEGTLSLPPSDPLLRLSDLYWISEDRNLVELGVPRLIENFSTSDDIARARAQLFSAGKDSIALTWTLLGERADTVRVHRRMVLPTGEIQNVEDTIHIKGRPAQRYTLWLEAMGNGRRETRAMRFNVRIPGITSLVTDLDQAIRQLKYVASSEEYSRLKQAQPVDRERLFKEFWKKRAEELRADVNDVMESFYGRVQYANEHFRTNHEGWDTDRGHIYILYGEPTDIERHPFEAGSYPYEVWYYSSLAKRFMFVDYTGFGDYNLVTPEWGY